MENSVIDYESIFKLDPYSLCKEEKESLLTQNIRELCKFHYKHCNEYKRILDALGVGDISLDSNPNRWVRGVGVQNDKVLESTNSKAQEANSLESAKKTTQNLDSYYNAPFLPVRLFKYYTLKSIEKVKS